MDVQFVYRLATKEEWSQVKELKQYSGTEKDTAGFIHLSTAKQVRRTATKLYSGRDDILVLSVDCADLKASQLKWEGEVGLYPHYYGDIPMKAIKDVQALSLNHEGLHVFPEGLTHISV
jgi:uncharacterized protein (DUF952 family)